jgi:hypothetical protein
MEAQIPVVVVVLDIQAQEYWELAALEVQE